MTARKGYHVDRARWMGKKPGYGTGYRQ